jgi:hypothetical protein
VQEELRQIVDAVASRMRRPAMWRYLAIGLLAGGGLGILAAGVRLAGGWDFFRWIALGCVVVLPLAAAAVAWNKKIDPLRAIRAIDAHYQLKSRAMTLWSYLGSGELDEAQGLVVGEAWPHVKRADAKEVVPVDIPKTIYGGAALALLAIVLILLPVPTFNRTARSQDGRPQVVTDGAELTALAPVRQVDPLLAERSIESVSRPGNGPNPAGPTASRPGSGELIKSYFNAIASPQPE